MNNNGVSWVKLSFIFSFGWALIYFDRVMLTPVIKYVLTDFNISISEVGIIFSIFFLGYTLLQIPGGILASKFGIEKIIKISFLGLAIISLLNGLVTSFYFFITLRFLAGAFEGIYYGPQFSLSSKYVVGKYKTFATTIINSGMSIGIILGNTIPVLLVDNYSIDYKFLYFMVFFISLFLVYLLGKNIPVIQDGYKHNQFKVNKELIKIFFISFSSLYAFFHLLTWIQVYLSEEKLISTSVISISILLISVISIFSSLIFSLLVDKYNAIGVFIKFLLFFTVISICIFVYSDKLNVLIFSLVMYGIFGKMALDPILIVAVSKLNTNNNLSTTLSIFNFVGLLSSIIAPYVGGKVLEYTGSLNMSFMFSVVLLFIAFGVSFSLNKYD
ncbi:hypothetical protein CEP45_03235 [Mergibacter septicus]|uniref:MFS transporter n=1 Tax=Mergibacter septicus TaxID=221402 RepID=UPI001C77F095|nr:MFS transporter [Mergibacter septicus]QDJ12922.1 hypothetical protein CEP45_03235 [Mergibacter septicus]